MNTCFIGFTLGSICLRHRSVDLSDYSLHYIYNRVFCIQNMFMFIQQLLSNNCNMKGKMVRDIKKKNKERRVENAQLSIYNHVCISGCQPHFISLEKGILAGDLTDGGKNDKRNPWNSN